MSSPSIGGQRPGAGSRQPIVMLALATLGFAVNFWAWACSVRWAPATRTC